MPASRLQEDTLRAKEDETSTRREFRLETERIISVMPMLLTPIGAAVGASFSLATAAVSMLRPMQPKVAAE